MDQKEVYRAIGLMSGTSLDGVDGALIETDGYGLAKPLGFLTLPYPDDLRELLRSCLGEAPDLQHVKEAEAQMTDFHARVVSELLNQAGVVAGAVDIVGFHGQTIFHDPKQGKTVQIGDGERLARITGIDVIHDFRRMDVEAGGQGAPFLPLYHQAKAAGIERPLVILNIGGVANITWLGETPADILAFDTSPGNALMDDVMAAHSGQAYDANGEMARRGTVDMGIVQKFLADPYFARPAPKSLDRDQWSADLVQGLSVEDALATLCEMSVQAIARGIQLCPQKPGRVLVAGGGRHNGFMMERLSAVLGIAVSPVEAVGWDGDALEAEGFAYLAVRSLLDEPLSLPSTTGVKAPQKGGTRARAA